MKLGRKMNSHPRASGDCSQHLRMIATTSGGQSSGMVARFPDVTNSANLYGVENSNSEYGSFSVQISRRSTAYEKISASLV